MQVYMGILATQVFLSYFKIELLEMLLFELELRVHDTLFENQQITQSKSFLTEIINN